MKGFENKAARRHVMLLPSDNRIMPEAMRRLCAVEQTTGIAGQTMHDNTQAGIATKEPGHAQGIAC